MSKIHTVKQDSSYDAVASGKNLFQYILEHFFTQETYLCHPDPHPANIIVRKNGKVSIIDQGLLVHIDKEQLHMMKKLFLAVYAQNIRATVHWALTMSNVSHKKYAKKVWKDFRVYLSQTPHKDVGFWFIEVTRIFIKHRIPVPTFLSAFGRSIVVLDGCLQYLDASLTTVDILGETLKSALRREIISNICEVDYMRVAYHLSDRLKEAPSRITEMADVLIDDPERILQKVKRVLTSVALKP